VMTFKQPRQQCREKASTRPSTHHPARSGLGMPRRLCPPIAEDNRIMGREPRHCNLMK
jgi:hypothetical protein